MPLKNEPGNESIRGISSAEKRKLIRRKRLKRERILLQTIRKQRKVALLKISTIKVTKPRIGEGEALAILIGTQIGAGVLGLPYAASKVGLFPAVAVLFAIMLFMLFTSLIVLRFSAEMGGAQMSTIAQNVLGKAGGWMMYISITIMGFGALLAYVAGMGNVIANLFGVGETMGAIIFWVFASIVIYLGIEASGKVELMMSYVMFILFIGVTAMLLPHARMENAFYMKAGGIFSIVGVAIFALGCHTVIPDIYKGLGSYNKARKVVILAFHIPTSIYAFFMASFLLAFGLNTPQIATQGLEGIYGKIGVIIGNSIPMIAITTSYIGLGLAQQSNSMEFIRIKKSVAWLLTVIPPILVYLAGVKNFADVLAFAGDTGDMVAFIILPILILIVKRYRDNAERRRKSIRDGE